MTKFTKNWKLGLIGASLIVSQLVTANIEDDFKVTKPIFINLTKWVSDLFDSKINYNISTFISKLNKEVLEPSARLQSTKSTTEPEKQLRSMMLLLDTQLKKVNTILSSGSSYLNIAKKMQSEFDLSNTLTTINNQFDSIIKLIQTSHPKLAKEMIEFKKTIIEPARNKWVNKPKSDLLSALKHRCACK